MAGEIDSNEVRCHRANDRRWWFFWCGDTYAGAARA
jgi:hypothetical protein